MFKQLKDLIGVSINRAGLQGEVKALSVINEYKRMIKESLGENAYKNLVPKFFKQNILYIDASNAGWAQKLHMKSNIIIELINESLNDEVVEKIIIKNTGVK